MKTILNQPVTRRRIEPRPEVDAAARQSRLARQQRQKEILAMAEKIYFDCQQQFPPDQFAQWDGGRYGF